VIEDLGLGHDGMSTGERDVEDLGTLDIHGNTGLGVADLSLELPCPSYDTEKEL
jgi:hypothetical protein